MFSYDVGSKTSKFSDITGQQNLNFFGLTSFNKRN